MLADGYIYEKRFKKEKMGRGRGRGGKKRGGGLLNYIYKLSSTGGSDVVKLDLHELGQEQLTDLEQDMAFPPILQVDQVRKFGLEEQARSELVLPKSKHAINARLKVNEPAEEGC